MIDNRRWPRVRQSGIECSEAGCTEDRVSNDLCPKHGMRRHRLTEKGRAQIKRYNKRYKRPDIDKACSHCKKSFITAREAQELCNECSPVMAPYYAQKKHRAKHLKKSRIRDATSKRIERGYLKKLPCEVCGDENSEAHHYNYEHPLNINWLCKKHHGEEHKKLKQLQEVL